MTATQQPIDRPPHSTDPAAPVPTLPQTVCLLALSRGQQPPIMAAITRRALRRHRWIIETSKVGAPRRIHEITDAGRDALARSPHRDAAARTLAAARGAS